MRRLADPLLWLVLFYLSPVSYTHLEKTLQQLNAKIAVEGQDASSVAKAWLEQKKLL